MLAIDVKLRNGHLRDMQILGGRKLFPNLDRSVSPVGSPQGYRTICRKIYATYRTHFTVHTQHI